MITLRIIYFLLFTFSIAAGATQNESNTWEADCVGRTQLRLPSEIEIAAETIRSWKENKDNGSVFQDGQRAGWSSLYFGGPIEVTHALSAEQHAELLKAREVARERFRKSAADDEDIERQFFEMVSVAPQTGMAWDYGKNRYAHRYVSLNLGRHILGITYGNRPEDSVRVESDYRTLLAGLRERPLFDVPHEPGVCLPYAFIRDNGNTRRHIAVTYRLKAHPDVTIWFADANATEDRPRVRAETLTARYRAKFFWEQDYQNAKRVESEWTPGYRRTTIDGRDAIETFVKLVRYENNIEDYGYLAVVRGDPDATEDTPDLMLYVIRDAANATKRGLTPIGRDELLDLARRIAASVRRRPVGRREM